MARQFDVFVSPQAMRRNYPYFIVIQHDSVPSTDQVITAPLVLPSFSGASRLHPLLELPAGPLVLLTTGLAAMPRRVLRRPVANVGASRHLIVAAIDLLIVGS